MRVQTYRTSFLSRHQKYEAKHLDISNLAKWTTQTALGYLNTRETLEG